MAGPGIQTFNPPSTPYKVVVSLEQLLVQPPCPPQAFRDVIRSEIKLFFDRKKVDFWGDLERQLWYSVQFFKVFKDFRLRLSIHNVVKNDLEGFNFEVLFSERPPAPSPYPTGPAVNPIFGMKVEIGIVVVDTLQSMSGILIAKALGERKVEKLDIPKKLAQIVITFQDKDLC